MSAPAEHAAAPRPEEAGPLFAAEAERRALAETRRSSARARRGQAARILEHLETGARLTQAEALERFGCSRLASRVDELRRAGHPIKSALVRVRRADGTFTAVAEYRLERGA